MGSTCATRPFPRSGAAVGIVFEDTFLFSDTIAANIAFADPNASRAEIERAAQLSRRARVRGGAPRGV